MNLLNATKRCASLLFHSTAIINSSIIQAKTVNRQLSFSKVYSVGQLVIPTNLATNNLKQPENKFLLEDTGSTTQYGTNRGLGYFRHNIATPIPLPYQRDIIKSGASSIKGCLKDCLGQNALFIGPKESFDGYYIEASLVSMTPGKIFIYSFHKFYDPTNPGDTKFLNPIYIPSKDLEIDDDCYKLQLKIARSLQDDLLLDSGPTKSAKLKCWIKNYLTGEIEEIYITPYHLVKKFNLNDIWLAIRRVQLQSDGTYLSDPNDPILLSNPLTIVTKSAKSKNDLLSDNKIIVNQKNLPKKGDKICR